MAASQDGDTQAYGELLEAFYGYIYAFVKRKLSDPEGVEEVVQEALLSIHKARQSYDRSQSVKPWALAIANNRLVDYLRKNKKHFQANAMDFEDAYFLEAEVEISTHHFEDFQKAFDLLSPQQQQIVKLIKVDGLSIKDVAIKMQMTETAVKVAAHRGYKKLKAYILEKGHEH